MTATRNDLDYVLKVIDDTTTALDDLEFTPQADNVITFSTGVDIHKVVLDLLNIKRVLCKKYEKLGVWY